ncbi:MAG: type II 3-dehydroquinate dehydratase [Chromatiales bacterium]|nr:type II 3-dehydroquinate dehydratase [Chromatiales bacterium]
MASILLLNGPNLNLLGQREPEVYGRATLADIEQRCRDEAERLGHQLACRQSNSEGGMVDWLQQHAPGAQYLIINPGAYGHTSIALRDALLGLALPFVEVHLSNVYAREEFRRSSMLTDIAVGCISGLGAQGYLLAIQFVAEQLRAKR